jgi:hypothetical protein
MCKGECVVRREHNNEGFIVAFIVNLKTKS